MRKFSPKKDQISTNLHGNFLDLNPTYAARKKRNALKLANKWLNSINTSILDLHETKHR